ncbi:hypothetical protein C8F01DRAFT_1139275 [Mycena amicta]|nr:hypothetical protein C8F01DRAFT_1139275 [Mycena amicta]
MAILAATVWSVDSVLRAGVEGAVVLVRVVLVLNLELFELVDDVWDAVELEGPGSAGIVVVAKVEEDCGGGGSIVGKGPGTLWIIFGD